MKTSPVRTNSGAPAPPNTHPAGATGRRRATRRRTGRAGAWLLTAALLTASALQLAPAASAQLRPADGPAATAEVRHVCALYGRGDAAVAGPAIDLSAVEAARRGGAYQRVESGGGGLATFQVSYSANFTTQARNAFQRAVDIWAAHLTSSVQIRIKADFDPLETDVLGQAGFTFVHGLSFGGVTSWYPPALADALLGRDLAPESDRFDIEATFSSSFPRFYFGLDGRPPSNQIDFVSVVLHELGHGLGFIGSGDVDDGAGEPECTGVAGTGCVGVTGSDGLTSPIVFDRFLDDASGRSLLDATVYPNNSLPLGDLLQSGALFVDAPTVVRVYDGVAPVWAPSPFEGGSSFSHWDEAVVQGSSAALMTPRLASGEAYQDPGDITCAFFADMGWPLGPGCQTLTVANEPELAARGVALESAGPNPARGATSVRLRQPSPGDVRVTLHDALGRQLATLVDGPAPTERDVAVPVAGLAPGVYHVVARTVEGTVTRALTVVR